MKEGWKDIPNYEGLYEASSLGRIRSRNRTIDNRKYSGKIIKPQNNGHGYYHVTLAANKKHSQFYVHRLVALTFLPNPSELPEVNHIDENPANNCVDNLEWCTAKYNSNYGNHGQHVSEGSKKSIRKRQACVQNGMKTAKPVVQMKMDGTEIKVWPSMGMAAKMGNFNRCNIQKCCIGEYYQHKGFRWKFVK
ncbi:NUMOD4 domain-containing protein [uncultured Lentilactobacillus sp.]|uniref:NUMOD4 domain-containing protein n=1 Tax=uncultured Lentilactobacillus sp. TaxID=2805375 RepID=UPI0025971CA1|nr:NUMOD4 domain-containing protein [uncultured Lentilactobacillus sp.]